MYEAIRSGKYDNDYEAVKRPNKPIKPRENQCDGIDDYCAKTHEYADSMKAFGILNDKYKEDQKKRGIRYNELIEQFKQDALEDVGLENHPRKEKAYDYAWDKGHSAGLQEVYSYLVDIADVLQD